MSPMNRWTTKIIHIFLLQEDYTEKIGDLQEVREQIASERGVFHANFWYLFQLVKAIPTFMVNTMYWRCSMWINGFKVAIRKMRRQKGTVILNLLGLTSGIVACLLIALYVDFECGYDRFHPNGNRIYRVCMLGKSKAGEQAIAMSKIGVGPALKERFPEVEEAVRCSDFGEHRVRVEDQLFLETRILYVDPGFYGFFGIRFLRGGVDGMMRPGSMALTQSMSKKLFAETDPVGRFVRVDTTNYEVAAVIADCPANTHLKYSMLVPLVLDPNNHMTEDWGPMHLSVYIRLAHGTDPFVFENKIRRLPHDYIGQSLDQNGRESTLFLQPIASIHLKSHLIWENEPPGNPAYVILFSLVGLFILLISALNFINLATARSVLRSCEVGVRKVLGAQRRQLIVQFLSESVILTLVASIIGMMLVNLILPFFNQISGLPLNWSSVLKPGMILVMVLFVVVIGLFAGMYPALVLSAFQPVSAIHGEKALTGAKPVLRRILVILQFTISTTLIIGTLFFNKQLQFMKKTNLGFDREQKLVIEFTRDLVKIESRGAVKEEFLKHPDVLSGTFSSSVPGRWMYFWRIQSADDPENSRAINCFGADADFFDEYDIRMAAGRPYLDGENRAWVLNEAAVKAYGWNSPEEALTHSMQEPGNPIIGVVQDWHFRGLQQPIEPMAILPLSEDVRYLTLRVNTERIGQVVDFVKETHKRLYPDEWFNTFFLDQDFNSQYLVEERIGKLFHGFSLLGIFIACLGLLGLASFMAERRSREIAIRKVVGASGWNIARLLAVEFCLWVLIASGIAWPLSWLGLNIWFRNFAYRVPLTIGPFILSGCMALSAALLTVSWHTWKASRINPAEALKSE